MNNHRRVIWLEFPNIQNSKIKENNKKGGSQNQVQISVKLHQANHRQSPQRNCAINVIILNSITKTKRSS